MREENLLNLGLALGLFILGVMFLKGYFHEEHNTRFRKVMDIDKIIFPNLNNQHLIHAADKLAFKICLVMAMLTAFNGIISYLYVAIPNVSAIFLFLGLIGSWVARFLFIAINKANKGTR